MVFRIKAGGQVQWQSGTRHVMGSLRLDKTTVFEIMWDQKRVCEKRNGLDIISLLSTSGNDSSTKHLDQGWSPCFSLKGRPQLELGILISAGQGASLLEFFLVDRRVASMRA